MTKESFGNWFRGAVKAAGVAKSAHGLRKAAATADALAGWTDAELDAKYGWTGRKMASLYTKPPAGKGCRWRPRSAQKANSKSRTLWGKFPHL